MDEDYIIKKWLANELTDAELKVFKESKGYDLNTKIIDTAKQFKASQFSTVKNYDEFKADLKDKNTPVIKLKPYKVLYRIAALFIIGFSTYFLFFYNNLTTVETLASQKTTFELPDASSVVLNADSKAQFNKKKWIDKREVSLEGEAFFKVAKGSKFDVITSGGTISVLGTQFSVKNRSGFFEVKCFEGIVSVSSNGKLQRLTKGKTYRILNNLVAIDSTYSSNPEWIDNKSSFKSVPLYEVLDELERQYNVTINTQKVDDKRLFTGGFIHDDLEQALIAITVPFDLTYKKENSNKITISSGE
ncbi:MAG: FecR family protein [Flavobacteriaceae bacterium]|nr:FecR family protein [Flavobacteriaceae bacterium]